MSSSPSPEDFPNRCWGCRTGAGSAGTGPTSTGCSHAELNYRKVIGVEVTASSAPNRESARHLIWLRDQLGEVFVGGVVLHTGPHVYRLDDRIVAAPIACLWS